MAVETNQVFLVPGQRKVSVEGGAMRLSPAIEHCVVIAQDMQEAQVVTEQAMPDFVPVGFTSLADFEKAVVQLRDTLAGKDTGWPVIVAPSMG